MVKRLLFLFLLLPLFSLGQFQGGLVVVNGVAVHQPDTSAYKVINTIQQEGTALNGASRFYVTYLISSTKAIGVWDLCKAFYGFVGGTAASHKWNWKDMRDVDGAFRLQFFNSPTHNSTGVLWNGTTQYANTFFNATSLTNTSTHISYYTQTNNITGVQVPIGAIINSTNFFQLNFTSANFLSGTIASIVSYTQTSSRGFTLGTRQSINSQRVFRNGNLVASSTVSGSNTLPNATLYLGARNNPTISSADLFSVHTASFATIGDGLTDTEAIAMSNTVYFTQRILNRA
jgi:hypothetical protein